MLMNASLHWHAPTNPNLAIDCEGSSWCKWRFKHTFKGIIVYRGEQSYASCLSTNHHAFLSDIQPKHASQSAYYCISCIGTQTLFIVYYSQMIINSNKYLRLSIMWVSIGMRFKMRFDGEDSHERSLWAQMLELETFLLSGQILNAGH